MKKRFLFVSPHPDDAELGIGGTIIKLTKQGHTVCMVDLTSGEPTPYGTEAKRKKETRAATTILGVTSRVNVGLPNRYLMDTKEARLMLAEQIRRSRPDYILCPYPADAHPDHLATTTITEAARFYAKYTTVSVPGDPHYAPHLFYFLCSHLRTIPTLSFFVDISDYVQDKMRAMRCYRSQFVTNKKNTFIFDYIETQNRYFGRLIRTAYAEGVYTKEALSPADCAPFI